MAAVLLLGGCGGRGQNRLVEEGRALPRAKACVSCHTVDGKPSVGPTWKGLYGSKIVLSDGTTVTADDAYLRESILHPSRKTVKGFQPGLMETVVKENSLSDEEVAALIAYIKSLR